MDQQQRQHHIFRSVPIHLPTRAKHRERNERLRRHAEQRARHRHAARTSRHGTLRFSLVLLTLIATAVVVTIVMFNTLYVVMR